MIDLALAADGLRIAREKIMKFGWVQRYSGNESRGFCLTGAINDAKHDKAACVACAALSFISMKFVVLTGGYSMIMWNDAAGRTVEQVLDLLDRAIEMAMSETKMEDRHV